MGRKLPVCFVGLVRPRSGASRLLLPLLCLTLAACQEPVSSSAKPAPEAAAAPGLVARFGGVEVSVAELDRHVLALPARSRPGLGADLEAWYRQQIREIVVERVLHTEGTRLAIADTPGFARQRRDAERQLTLQMCLRETLKGELPITEAALRTAYEEREEAFAQPERRSVFHIFRRLGEGGDGDAAYAEMEQVRKRVLKGENFKRLASALSDSESRHREGTFGWVTRGRFQGVIDDVLFGLEEGVPSAPVATPQGVHLFYVDAVLPARELTFPEVRQRLARELTLQRIDAALAELASQAEDAVELAAREQFEAWVRSGEPDAVVLRAGETTLSLGELRRRASRVLADRTETAEAFPALVPMEFLWQQLLRERRDLLAAEHCRAHALVPAEPFNDAMERWEARAVVAERRQQRLLEVAQADPARLEAFYEGNVGQFTTSPRWHLQRLIIPVADDGPRVFARLEQAALRPGETLEGLRDALGGAIEDLGFRNAVQLRALSAKLPRLVAPLSAGALSAPYLGDRGIEMVQVVAREEARPLPLQEVRGRVAEAVVAQYTTDLYERLVADVLATDELIVYPSALKTVQQAGVPAPDVDVDQLMRLLEEL